MYPCEGGRGVMYPSEGGRERGRCRVSGGGREGGIVYLEREREVLCIRVISRQCAGKFRSPGNEIFRQIDREISFPGERNFPTNRPRNFVPRGTKFFRQISRKISFPGERNFSTNRPRYFVPRGTKFSDKLTKKFRSPGNEIFQTN